MIATQCAERRAAGFFRRILKLCSHKLISEGVRVLRMIVEISANDGPEKDGRRTDQQREPKRLKGEIVKKIYASMLAALLGLLGLGVAAEAQTRGKIVVTLPFEFVASGKTLPAGTYTVTRIGDEKLKGLILSSYKNRTSVFVGAVEVEHARVDNPGVSFEKAGGQNFLSRIQTANDVYQIAVSRSEILQAEQKSHDNGSASGSSVSK
jgi:hypothetical protein